MKQRHGKQRRGFAMNRRPAFTLIETLVAMVSTSVLAVTVFGGLLFVSRGYRRDELAMSRMQVAENVFELLADDLKHQQGTAFPAVNMLEANGYLGMATQFLVERRRGTNLVQVYAATSTKPTNTMVLPFDQETDLTKGGDWTASAASRYLSGASGGGMPPPYGALKSAVLVPLPPHDPDVIHLALSTRHSSDLKRLPEQVLWSFWRRRRGKFDAGQILRTSATEKTSFASTARLVADVQLTFEWALLKTPKNTVLEPVEELVEITLRNPGDLALPFEEPTFMVRRRLTAGL